MMTAQERADKAFNEWEKVSHTGVALLGFVADAIRAAKQAARAEEREACALLCETWGCDGYPECANGRHNVLCHHYIAVAIRAMGAK